MEPIFPPLLQKEFFFKLKASFFLPVFILFTITSSTFAQTQQPVFQYRISFPEPASQSYHVELYTSGWQTDSVDFKMPVWMPGYYQLLDYPGAVKNLSARNEAGHELEVSKPEKHIWRIKGTENRQLILAYDVQTERKFVALSFVDEQHAYLAPGNSFLYVDDYLQLPVKVMVQAPEEWPRVATGLKASKNTFEFSAENFDILYDSPILIGDLEELPPFEVRGVKHRFIGYNMGDFDKAGFIEKLKGVVETAVETMGDIPFEEYTFIGIGPGRGGIEHLNNTTVSFDGSNLHEEEAMHGMLSFLAHEYFHHYNAKRIRPVELGPFDYSRENRTYLLWISEGLTSYYDNLIVRRAGMGSVEALFADLEGYINNVENDPGRHHQSLMEASYSTWEDGPFGDMGDGEDRSISYYQKGPIIGLLLDLSIRNATRNKRSLDDVMRFLYQEYYQEEQRGFTGAEFQQACESIAGENLSSVFEFIYTTKEIDYNTYLNYAGLGLENVAENKEQKKYQIKRLSNLTFLQSEIQSSWLGEKK